MSLPTQLYPNPSRIVVGTPTIYNDDVVLYCDTTLAAVTINLLDIPDAYWSTQYKLYIVDFKNNASTHNITINAGSGQTINAASSVTINTNGGSAIVRISGNTTYVCEPIANTLNDTGWVDLNGFSWISSANSRKPQFRIYGKQVFFRGTAIVPLSNTIGGDLLIPMTEAGIGAYYVNDAYPYVYQGSGGCVLNSSGALQFNEGNSIFPSGYSVSLDKLYQTGYQLATRVVKTRDANSGVALSSVFNTYISSTGVLTLQTYKDIESSPYIPNPVFGIGSGGARQLISRVKLGEYVVNWQTQANGWTQSSIINTGNIRNWTIPSGSNQFLFSCDPAEETDIGGFQVNLDGLTAFTL
jgi:phage baseplate assembly protein gpV